MAFWTRGIRLHLRLLRQRFSNPDLPRMVAGRGDALPAPLCGLRGGDTRASLAVLLALSGLCLVGATSSHDGDPEQGRDSPSPAGADPSARPSLALGSPGLLVLPRLRGVQVGHKQELELVPDKIHFMKTLSLKPLAFEIPNFLSEDECKLLIRLAKREGLKKSSIAFSKERADYIEQQAVNQMEIFNFLDLNQDGQLQIIEMLSHERLANGQWLIPEDIQEMYSALKADPDGNGVLSLDEFKGVNMWDFYKYMDRKKANKSELVRNSKQVWLVQGKGADPIIHAIQQRVIQLTHLPAEMIEFSESLQIVQYPQGGYYHAHWDSENGFVKDGCIHTKLSGGFVLLDDAAPCRYATVLIYLNNVTSGGETNFPIADNRTYEEPSLIQNNIDLRDTNRHCDKGNLRIKPVQGTAVFWYNHLLDDEGWIGDLDEYSLHGGCLVTEGTKWIANQWINVDHNKNRQLLFQKQITKVRDQSVDKSYSDVHVEL